MAHFAPPADSLARQQEPATPAKVVFPRFRKGRSAELKALPRSLAFTRLANNSFNYRLLGADGFRTLTALVRNCDAYSLEYGDLDKVIPMLDDLVCS